MNSLALRTQCEDIRTVVSDVSRSMNWDHANGVSDEKDRFHGSGTRQLSTMPGPFSGSLASMPFSKAQNKALL